MRQTSGKGMPWEWNYGASPVYNMRRELKLPAGLITVYMQVERGCIEHIRFYGDFFGNGDIAVLEEAIKGIRLDSALEKNLASLDIGRYINGMTSSELLSLLMY